MKENVGQTNNIPGGNLWNILGIPDSISQNDLESKASDIFRECDADIDPVNIEVCHRLKSNHWPKKVILKLARRKHPLKILRGKKKLKTTDLSQIDFETNTIVFINQLLLILQIFIVGIEKTMV